MEGKNLHIVSFDVPFPADYGGAIDIFYRIKALHAIGVKIHLHCFEYGRGMQDELKKYVSSINYYKRKRNVADSLSRLPFIVKSRDSRHLIRNLLKDDYPILFEGLHTCFFLPDERLKSRLRIVRMHNIEHEYYLALGKQSSGWRKRFFNTEAKKLKRYESVLKHADHILAIKESDAKKLLVYSRPVHVLPASTAEIVFEEYSTTDPFCLYHGNLSVAENESAVHWLVNQVFIPLKACDQFVVAGKRPSKSIQDLCTQHHIKLIPNPSEEELSKLLHKARVHVLYTEQSTGVKLKLIHALNTSGHVVVNHKMIEGTDLVPFCNLALIVNDYRDLVSDRLERPLSEIEYDERIAFLRENYSTRENCKKILVLLG